VWSSVWLAAAMEVLLARKMPVPEIPPVPSPRASRSTKAGGVPPSRTTQAMQSEESDIPDLLEAFWGDAAATPDPAGSPRPDRCRSKRLARDPRLDGRRGT
jgi:hypothetical protein